MAKNYTTVLSIAGSDSIGGAGIQADIKTCSACGVYAMTAITAVTAQNTYKVADIHPIPPAFVREQLKSIFTDVEPDAIKIGMLPDAKTAHEVARFLKVHAKGIPVVVDPVMVSTAGNALAKKGVTETIIHELVPLATLITPNIPEAIIIGDMIGVVNPAEIDMHSLAWDISDRMGANILLKGGHITKDTVILEGETMKEGMITDILMTPSPEDLVYQFDHPKIDTLNTHGTGCSLSTAIACGLAKRESLADACQHAIDWLQKAIAAGAGYELGRGHGPINFTMIQ